MNEGRSSGRTSDFLSTCESELEIVTERETIVAAEFYWYVRDLMKIVFKSTRDRGSFVERKEKGK